MTVTAHNGVRWASAKVTTPFGRAETDTVLAGYFDDGHVDTGVDTIHTGAGPDFVRSNGGDDTVSLGKGADQLQWGPATRRRTAAAAGLAVPRDRRGQLSAGQPERQPTEDGQVVPQWSSFADFEIGGPVALVLGGREDETFTTGRGAGPNNGWTIRAGGGDDVMSGTSGGDTLLGGLGHDSADGRRGDDLCKAEHSEHCERH